MKDIRSLVRRIIAENHHKRIFALTGVLVDPVIKDEKRKLMLQAIVAGLEGLANFLDNPLGPPEGLEDYWEEAEDAKMKLIIAVKSLERETDNDIDGIESESVVLNALHSAYDAFNNFLHDPMGPPPGLESDWKAAGRASSELSSAMRALIDS
jgi:hypothetical protein